MVQIKSGLWVNPRVPEMIGMPELENLAKSYGKFWCTWQVDRGIHTCVETSFILEKFLGSPKQETLALFHSVTI